MGKLSSISSREARRVFTHAGFYFVSQKGSHIKMRRELIDGTMETIIIPDHKRLKEGTLRKGILRVIHMSEEEFVRLLKK